MTQKTKQLFLLVLLCLPNLGSANTLAIVQIADAVLQEVAPKAWYSGTVIGKEHARLAMEVAGNISEIMEVGDRVKQGEAVARIDPKPLTLALKVIEAEATTIEAQLNFYQKEAVRLTALAAQSHIAKSQLDEIIADRDELSGRLAVIEARATQAQDQLARTISYSPFAGVVTERFKIRGEYVVAGTAVLKLANTDTLEVQLRIPYRLLAYIKTEMRFMVADAAGRSVEAEFSTLVPVADALSRLYELRLRLPPQHSWMAGRDVRVAIPTGKAHRAVLVPQDALVIRHNGNSLFRVAEDGTAEQIIVETGVVQEDLIEIIAGIKAGDQVVVRGNELLHPGQQISVQKPIQ